MFYTDHLLIWWHHNSSSIKVKRIQKNEFSYPEKSRNLLTLNYRFVYRRVKWPPTKKKIEETVSSSAFQTSPEA